MSSNNAGAAEAPADAEVPGFVTAVAVQPSGGVIVGGNFYNANEISRAHILRLMPGGTLDPTWNPSANNDVYALTADTNDNVYVGGSFTSIGGLQRAYVAKLSGSTGTADATWNPSANSDIYTLGTDISGNVYAGGAFSHIGGQERAFVAKLLGTGTGDADANWNPMAGYPVLTLATDTVGNVYAGGYFLNIGGQPRRHIAKLLGTGSGVADAIWNPSADGYVSALAIDASGNVYAGGGFNDIGGQRRYGIAKLSGSGIGAADAIWNLSLSVGGTIVNTLAIDSNSDVFAGGYFSYIGGQTRRNIAKLSGTGTGAADANWNPTATDGVSNTDSVSSVAIDGSGIIYVGGGFTHIGGQNRIAVSAFAPDGLFANGFEK